ncbi:MAG: hypothetical protein AAFQ87_22430, partial [Bacteroidota bacterium]
MQAQSLSEQFAKLAEGKQMRLNAETHLSLRLHLILAHYQQENELPITALVNESELGLQFDYSLFLHPGSEKVNIRIQAEKEDRLLPE